MTRHWRSLSLALFATRSAVRSIGTEVVLNVPRRITFALWLEWWQRRLLIATWVCGVVWVPRHAMKTSLHSFITTVYPHLRILRCFFVLFFFSVFIFANCMAIATKSTRDHRYRWQSWKRIGAGNMAITIDFITWPMLISGRVCFTQRSLPPLFMMNYLWIRRETFQQRWRDFVFILFFALHIKAEGRSFVSPIRRHKHVLQNTLFYFKRRCSLGYAILGIVEQLKEQKYPPKQNCRSSWNTQDARIHFHF